MGNLIIVGANMTGAILLPKIMAIIVIVLGLAVSMPFHIFVRERADMESQSLPWYKWLMKPQFYLVRNTL